MSKLEPFDPKIERTFHRLQNVVETRASRQKQKQEMEETLAHEAVIGAGAGLGARLEQPAPRSLIDYAQPSLIRTSSCIRKNSQIFLQI